MYDDDDDDDNDDNDDDNDNDDDDGDDDDDDDGDDGDHHLDCCGVKGSLALIIPAWHWKAALQQELNHLKIIW